MFERIKKQRANKNSKFQKKKNKITHLRYLVTPKGITLRTKLTLDFMKRKMREYEQLKRELDDVGNSQKINNSSFVNFKEDITKKICDKSVKFYQPKFLTSLFKKK